MVYKLQILVIVFYEFIYHKFELCQSSLNTTMKKGRIEGVAPLRKKVHEIIICLPGILSSNLASFWIALCI